MKKVEYCEMEWYDFEGLVKEVYGYEYEFIADKECDNDSDHAFNNITKKPFDPGNVLDQYDIKQLENFKQTGKYCGIYYILLRDLVNNDKLPEGNFLITVSW